MPSSQYLAALMVRFHSTVANFYLNTFNFFYTNLEDTSYFDYALKTPLAFVITTDVNSLNEPYVNNTMFKIN